MEICFNTKKENKMEKGALEDRFVYSEVKSLIEKYKIDTIIETGTYHGWSAKKFADFGLPVYTIEVNPDFLKKAKEFTNGTKNIFHYFGSSPQMLDEIFEERKLGNVLIFLDAHWGEYWPIHDEISTLQSHGVKPIILIHDFYVPDENGKAKFGYDVYKGQPLDYHFVKSSINDLYGGENNYRHYCIQQAEVNSGVGVFVPKKDDE